MERLEGGGLAGRPNSVWRLPGPAHAATLMLEAHLDTVTLDHMPSGTHPRREGGRLHGRGAVDCKGPLAAMLVAMERLRRRAAGPVAVVLAAVVDEEATQGGAQSLLESGLRPEAVVVAEPTSLGPVAAHGGVVRFQLITRGKAVHSSRPEQGTNAILSMAQVILALERDAASRLAQIHHPLCGHPAQTIAMIQGGRQYNLVPDECRVYIDRRTAPQEPPEQVTTDLVAWLDDMRRNRPDLAVELGSIDLAIGGLDMPVSHPLVAAAANAAAAVGSDPRVRGVPYGTDASTYWGVGGIPSVVVGPGDIAQAHTDDEWIWEDDLVRAVDLYVRIIDQAASWLAPGRNL